MGPAFSLEPLSGIWSPDGLNRDQVRRRLRVKETSVVRMGWSKQHNYHRGSNYSLWRWLGGGTAGAAQRRTEGVIQFGPKPAFCFSLLILILWDFLCCSVCFQAGFFLHLRAGSLNSEEGRGSGDWTQSHVKGQRAASPQGSRSTHKNKCHRGALRGRERRPEEKGHAGNQS